MGDIYVPYVIDGSKHSAQLFRQTFQQNVGDGDGVSRPGDLKVVPLNTPGPGFRVLPGGGVAQSRDSDASARESYGPIVGTEIAVPDVPGTGSSESRRDLVILEITDPNMQSVTYPEPATPEGWQDGANFARVTIIPNVDALVPPERRPVTSLAQITSGEWAHVTGVTLAAFNYPPSTATITGAMIEDLRVVKMPQSPRMERLEYRLGEDEKVTLTNTATYPAGATWPSTVEGAWGGVQIPSWATKAIVTATWTSVFFPPGSAWGGVWVQIGATVNPDNVKTPFTAWDSPNSSGNTRMPVIASGTVKIPEALRGTSQVFYPRANVNSGSTAASRPVLNKNGSVILDVVFIAEAV